MATKEEIDAMVSEYNAIEAAQTLRLAAIFRAVQSRKNYRIVKFGSSAAGAAVWSNCWDHPDRLAIPQFVDVLERKITEVIHGDDGSKDNA